MWSFATSDSISPYLRSIARIAAVVAVISVGGLISDYMTTSL